jgi:hypothetical protein
LVTSEIRAGCRQLNLTIDRGNRRHEPKDLCSKRVFPFEIEMNPKIQCANSNLVKPAFSFASFSRSTQPRHHSVMGGQERRMLQMFLCRLSESWEGWVRIKMNPLLSLPVLASASSSEQPEVRAEGQETHFTTRSSQDAGDQQGKQEYNRLHFR